MHPLAERFPEVGVASRVAFLWHLHQPDYRDPERGRPILPFVRLHALRGYRDLLLETAEHGTAWTINLVPSLLDQLLQAAAGVRDPTWELQTGPVEVLLEHHDLAVATLPSGHATMSRIHPRYAELRRRIEAGGRLDAAGLRDLQVWSLLAWFGATAHRDFPALGALVRKGRGFDDGDRAEVARIHDAVLAGLPAVLHRLPPGTISCSPYYHPILPLLVDAHHARRCMPHLPPTDFRWPADALRQLASARRRVAEVCGSMPIGLWPSEGSVSPEVVALVAKAGFRWLCTDRGVLERSERTGGGEGPWDLGHGVVGLFRDTDLSDRIGFRYAEWPAHAAAADLLGALAEREGTVLVALDGENPWESYADAGAAFRDGLRAGLDAGPVTAVTVDEAAAGPVVGRIRKLWTGSWIGADFRIWIGHEEDRRAWALLGDARRAADAAGGPAAEVAMHHLLAAEGSDWFWWFGDDFRTPFGRSFDALFRSHLRAAWRALGIAPPPALDVPILADPIPERSEPTRRLAVSEADPRSWLAWAGAGELRVAEGAMAVAHAVRRLSWGWDAHGALWVRLEARGEFQPAFPGRHFPIAGGVVSRVDGPAVSWSATDGATWPLAPLVFESPEAPHLVWWSR